MYGFFVFVRSHCLHALGGAIDGMRIRITYSNRRMRRRQAGQAMVEFALVIVFIFVLFVGILQMILLMYSYNTLADAAKEGMRYAVVHGTGLGAANCSGPGTIASANPAFTCTGDPNGSNVVTAVLGGSTCKPTCGLGGFSFQSISTTNNGCSPSSGSNISEVDVCYDPGSANSTNPAFGRACSQPGCLVRVTVAHTYKPLFRLGWPTVTLRAAADGRIMN
jgi:Flp pilus assembly pilin Flp